MKKFADQCSRFEHITVTKQVTNGIFFSTVNLFDLQPSLNPQSASICVNLSKFPGWCGEYHTHL